MLITSLAKPNLTFVHRILNFHIKNVFHLTNQNRNWFGSNVANRLRDGILHETKMVKSSYEYV